MSEELPDPSGLSGQEVGRVISYFAAVKVAIVEIQKGSLKVGDKIWIRGHTSDLLESVGSMQIDHRPVSEAQAREQVGVQVSSRVRRNDRVYNISG